MSASQHIKVSVVRRTTTRTFGSSNAKIKLGKQKDPIQITIKASQTTKKTEK